MIENPAIHKFNSHPFSTCLLVLNQIYQKTENEAKNQLVFVLPKLVSKQSDGKQMRIENPFSRSIL